MDLFNRKKVKQLEKQLEIQIEKANYIISELDHNMLLQVQELMNRASDIQLKDNLINDQKSIMDHLNSKLERTELLRRKAAGACGGYKTHISKLNKEITDKEKTINDLGNELIKANNKIDWLQKSRRAPSVEEIKAYDYSFKEVEKRQKLKA